MYGIVCVLKTATTVFLEHIRRGDHGIGMKDDSCRTLLKSGQSIHVIGRTTTPYYTTIIKHRQYVRVVILLKLSLFTYIARCFSRVIRRVILDNRYQFVCPNLKFCQQLYRVASEFQLVEYSGFLDIHQQDQNFCLFYSTER